MRVICLQLEAPVPGKTGAERRAAVASQVAAHRDAGLIVLPELWASGYFAFAEYERSAEPVPGPTLDLLGEAAAAAGSHVIAGSIIERGPDGRLHNTAALLGPDGELIAAYRKIHTFGYRSREAELIAGGEEVVVADTALGRIGLSACYDLRFPELYRAQVDAGAELLVVVAAWPRDRRDHWRVLTRARALESQAWMIACGAAGNDHGTALSGESCVIAPTGNPVAEAGPDPGVLEADLDRGAVAAHRTEFPALADRRLGAAHPPTTNRHASRQTAQEEVQCAPATSM